MLAIASPIPTIETDPLEIYKQTYPDGEVGFSAGFPSYIADFARDIYLGATIAARPDILLVQARHSANRQAKAYNPINGAEPGKIAHEDPDTALEGREGRTGYNACDTTSWHLIGLEGLRRYSQSSSAVFRNFRVSIENAVEYILSHVEDSVFVERPPKGAAGFALNTTFWKDSVLPKPDKEKPAYPVVYPQAHFIAARGLLSAARLLHDQELAIIADKMFRTGITDFMRPDGYVAYVDYEEELKQPSSDELHNLAFIPYKYGWLIPFDEVMQRAESLETPFGYMCTPPECTEGILDRYHTTKVWTQDNALANYGAIKHGRSHEAKVSSSIAPLIDDGQELFGVETDSDGNMFPKREGNSRQFWASASKCYFSNDHSSLLSYPWL